MRGAHGRVALFAAVLLAVVAAPARADYTPLDLIRALTHLDQAVHGKTHLSAAERAAVHEEKAQLIAAGAYTATSDAGVTYADALTDLDCIGASLQHARNAPRSNKRLELFWAGKGLDCDQTLVAALRAGGKALSQTIADMQSIGTQIRTIMERVRRHHVFGAKTTTLRHFIADVARRDFTGPRIFGQSFYEHFKDLECVDVKVESGRIRGASACVHRLRRLTRRSLLTGS